MSVVESIASERDKLKGLPLKATSALKQWEGVWLDEYARSQVDVDERMPPRDHHVFSVYLGDSDYVFQERLGNLHEGKAVAGYSAITPAGADCGFGGRMPEIITLRLTCERLDEAFEHMRRAGRGGKCELSNQFALNDRVLSNLAQMASMQLNLPYHPAQDLIIDSLCVALAMHAVRTYPQDSTELSPYRSEINERAVRRALAYIDDAKHDEVRLSSLADVAGVSRFHFSRVFKAYVGLSPAQYVERSLMERAKRLILRGGMRTMDIAAAVGFGDQSHFIRRFKHHVGCTPAAYSREGGTRRLYS